MSAKNAVSEFKNRYAGGKAVDDELTEAAVAKMTKAYEDAYARIYTLLNKSRKSVDYATYARQSQLLKAIGEQLDILKGTMGKHLRIALVQIARFSAQHAIKDLELLNKGTTKAETWHKKYGESYVEATFTDNFEHLAAQTDRMKKSVKRQLRQDSAEIFRAAAVEGTSRKQAYRQLRDKILERDPNFTFTDKAGRRWDTKRYLEMLTRTVLKNTMREAYVNECAKQGQDLVKVSRHQLAQGMSAKDKKKAIKANAAKRRKAKTKKARKGAGYVDACSLWEGKVLSLTGKTKGYPTLMDAQRSGEIFHPNCKHRLLAYDPTKDDIFKRMEAGESAEKILADYEKRLLR